MRRSSLSCARPWREGRAPSRTSRSVLLALQLGLKGLFALGHRGLIPLRIDPHIFFGAGLDAIQFPQHAEIRAVRAQKNIAWKSLQGGECASIVSLDSGIRSRLIRVVDQAPARVHIPAANNDHIERMPCLLHSHRPRRASSRMSGSLMGDERSVAEPHGIAVV